MKIHDEKGQLANRCVSIIELCSKGSINAHACNASSFMHKLKHQEYQGKGTMEVPLYVLRDLKELSDFYKQVSKISYSGIGVTNDLWNYKKDQQRDDDATKRLLNDIKQSNVDREKKHKQIITDWYKANE